MSSFQAKKIALLEEMRQAIGTSEIALESEPIAGGFMAFSEPGSWSNQACGLGLSGPVSKDEIERLIDFYVSRGVEPKIEVCPFADESLVQGLAAHNFTLREFEDVFAREIKEDENLDVLMPKIDGLEIKHVSAQNDDEIQIFVEVSNKGFQKPNELLNENFLNISKRAAKHPRSDPFLAKIDGIPAGGGGMETSGDIACLFGGSVLPEFRRRGIQRALIVTRMQQAQQKGAKFVCVHGTPGADTARNAIRLGFSLAYTKVILAMKGPNLIPSP